MSSTWQSDVLTTSQEPTFFAASDSQDIFLAYVNSRSKMAFSWLWYWAGGVQARKGKVPPPRNFWHYSASTSNHTFKLHRVDAQTVRMRVMPEMFACKWRWGFERLSWCRDLEALYFRNKAE